MTIRELSDFIKPTAGDNGQTQILAQFHQPQKPNTTDRQASVARSLSRSGKSGGGGLWGTTNTHPLQVSGELLHFGTHLEPGAARIRKIISVGDRVQ